ncbi:MAG: TetR/AcrR family transcriptional regulator [Myxococcales bacterium]|nr:TetR/AcrR family transcriptional regulator [Myxococcales bacterium]MCB9714602.1 TetR/AcrR family transcriptional regulator [Myxococcales bacterium]
MSTASAIVEPQQARSRRTLQRILDAFEQALHTQTFEEITVGTLCKRARCSVGTFYGRVESKDVLLDHLRQRVFEEARTALAELFSPARARSLTLSRLLAEQLAVLLDFHLQRRGVLRAVIVQARRQTAFAGPTRDFNTSVLRHAADAWLVHRDLIPHPDPEIAVEQAALMAAGYLRESVVFEELWPTPLPLDRDARLRQLHHLLLAFLTTPPPAEIP